MSNTPFKQHWYKKRRANKCVFDYDIEKDKYLILENCIHNSWLQRIVTQLSKSSS